jgi:DNA-sulfur modification-associated
MVTATKIKKGILMEGVTEIRRPGTGPVHRAVISMETLGELLEDARIRYAPRYQRGFKLRAEDTPEVRYDDPPLPINSPDLQIDPRRAEVMAVKFLQGRLYSVHLTWNARKLKNRRPAKFDQKAGTLELDTTLTIPDTAHRHLAYLTLWRWHHENLEVPEEVLVDDRPVTGREINKLLEKFDPSEALVFVDVYHLTPEQEGHLYDEFNSDVRPPGTAVAIDLNHGKTPSRQFIYRLMDQSEHFARDEIECRRNTIGSKSRKLTTNATLEAAVRPYRKELAELEKDAKSYATLIDFVGSFFEEWAVHFPAFQPGATADARNGLRDTSFALSNLMFHPLMRMAFELWREYQRNNIEWKVEMDWPSTIPNWREVIKTLSGTVSVARTDKEGKPVEDDQGRAVFDNVPLMARKNPHWRGKILVETLTKDGRKDWTLSSTRQTREAAFQYLCSVSGVKFAGRTRSNAR